MFITKPASVIHSFAARLLRRAVALRHRKKIGTEGHQAHRKRISTSQNIETQAAQAEALLLPFSVLLHRKHWVPTCLRMQMG
jgi:hypothetical protein